MFYTIRTQKEVKRGLARHYASQVKRAGPVIGVLRLHCHQHKEQSPPELSPVGAHLVDMRFGTWADAEKHIRDTYSSRLYPRMKRTFFLWASTVGGLCQNRDRLVALTIPLLIESQMNSVSAATQKAILGLLSPLVQSPEAPLYQTSGAKFSPSGTNADITVELHIGRTPFVLVCHSKSTLKAWAPFLEAATALLLTQIVIWAEAQINDEARVSMLNAIRGQLDRLNQRPPQLGELVDWPWLPRYDFAFAG